MPSCTRCLRDPVRRKCVVSADSDRCAECIRAGGNVSCDVWGPSKGDWERLEGAERRLVAEGDAALKEQQGLLSLLASVSAKLQRIEKQKKMFRARAADMLRRGLRSLDELDTAEEMERVAAEKEGSVGPPRTSEPIDLSDPGLDPALVASLSDFDPSDPFWADLDFDGGTSPVTMER